MSCHSVLHVTSCLQWQGVSWLMHLPHHHCALPWRHLDEINSFPFRWNARFEGILTIPWFGIPRCRLPGTVPDPSTSRQVFILYNVQDSSGQVLRQFTFKLALRVTFHWCNFLDAGLKLASHNNTGGDALPCLENLSKTAGTHACFSSKQLCCVLV